MRESDGARAVEVTALFDDAVLAVKHLWPAPRDERRARALVGAGALSLVGALAAFGVSVAQVASLRRAWDAAVAAGRARGPFVVPAGGRWLDAVVTLALGVGVAAIAAGVWRLLSESRTAITVGPAPAADLPTAPGAVPLDAFPLVRAVDGTAVSARDSTDSDITITFELLVADGMRGQVSFDGGPPQPLDGWPGARPVFVDGVAARACPLSEGARALVELGALRLLVAPTRTPPRVPAPGLVDWRAQAPVGAVALLAGALLALLYAMPPQPRSLVGDHLDIEAVAHFTVKAPEPPPAARAGDGGRGGGRPHAQEAGAAGLSTAAARRGVVHVHGNAHVDARTLQAHAAAAAAHAGILGVLQSLDGTHAGALFRPESALGPDADDLMSSLVGTSDVDGYGAGGLDTVGHGPGGGGSDERTIGAGNLRAIAPGGPGRRGGPPGIGGLPPERHTVSAVEPLPAPRIVTGDGLDRAIVRRVVRVHLNEVRFCYERQLALRPELGGRVVARFTIDGMGRVATSGIESSTVHDATVEGCIAQAVRRWEFPRPAGGGIVIVSYPFLLTASSRD